MVKISDLRSREVVNVIDGKRLGVIKDIDIDLEDGTIKSIVLPMSGRLFSMFGRNDEVTVPWSRIRKIGVDVILVEVDGLTSSYSDSYHVD